MLTIVRHRSNRDPFRCMIVRGKRAKDTVLNGDCDHEHRLLVWLSEMQDILRRLEALKEMAKRHGWVCLSDGSWETRQRIDECEREFSKQRCEDCGYRNEYCACDFCLECGEKMNCKYRCVSRTLALLPIDLVVVALYSTSLCERWPPGSMGRASFRRLY